MKGSRRNNVALWIPKAVGRRAATALLLIAFLFLSGTEGWGQTQKKKDLENKKQELQKEIEYQNKLLNEVKKNKNRSMIQLAILNNKIAKQQELISAIGKELELIEGTISETRQNIVQKETELKILKEDYAKIIYASYKNRDSYSRLMFLFAAQDFNQAFQRIKYMQYYTEARKKQAGLIEDTQRQLLTKKQELEDRKEQQSKTLSQKEVETGNLSKEKKNKEVVLTDLQQKEKDIRADIKKKKEQAEKLRKAIEKVIDDQIKKSNPSAKGDIKKITLTPEEKDLSNNFESNKGKLPWPLTEGVITEEFGTHDHPDMPGIKISNNGINIGTNKGANVRAVFGGTVVAVASVGGLEGKVIIIKHGEYLSVYSNMDETFVKSGEKVKTKQSIGKVLTDDNGSTELHFEIWKGQSMLNPESWIAKGN
jgi:septal ring factor EnvC (AmiA/AmiB activator)